MEKKLTDSEILSNVINALRLNPNSFNNRLGYNSKATVPHVINGLNSLSDDMITGIVNSFEDVNEESLKYGKEPILFNRETEYTFNDIPFLLSKILIELEKLNQK